jgi:putative ABC transport system ATP-binding protein
MSSVPLIQLQAINKIFHVNDVETHALQDIHLVIEQGEYVSISGASGCGKSTLLSLLGLLDTPSGGQYNLAGTATAGLSRAQRAQIRNEAIGFIFQSFNLISDLTVAENVELPLTYRDNLKASQRKDMVRQALARVEMSHRAGHFPSQLSGGQQQRVAIARAIVGQPKVLLADEPTGNLDSHNARIVMTLLDELHAQGATICMVTHDPRSASRAKRNIEIFDGRVVADQPVVVPVALAV